MDVKRRVYIPGSSAVHEVVGEVDGHLFVNDPSDPSAAPTIVEASKVIEAAKPAVVAQQWCALWTDRVGPWFSNAREMYDSAKTDPPVSVICVCGDGEVMVEEWSVPTPDGDIGWASRFATPDTETPAV